MNGRDWWTVEAMLIYGGSFAQALARAFRAADDSNLTRLKVAFLDYWTKYEAMGITLEKQREKAEAQK